MTGRVDRAAGSALSREPAAHQTARDVADVLEPLVSALPHRFTLTRRLDFVAVR